MTFGNTDVDWLAFDPEAYFLQYYGDPHPDDDEVVRRATAAMLSAEPAGERLDVVDVGTGPNLFPFLCALPRAARLTAWEYAPTNVEWLRRELQRDRSRPQWLHFWWLVREQAGAKVLPDDPTAELREMAGVERGSIFDLPAGRWDAATMFFCAESITADRQEFELACGRFARCVRPGGRLIAAFLANSAKYEVAGNAFPVVPIDERTITDTFASIARNVHATPIGSSREEIRSGYSSMIFLEATAI